MRKILVLTLWALALGIVAQNSEFWNRIESGDYEGFMEDYNASDKDTLDRGIAAYGLFETGDYNKDYGKEAIEIVSRTIDSGNKERDLELILSELYLYSIVDAKTWMDYGSKYEKVILSLEESRGDSIRVKINASKSMMWFPNPRGSNEKGEELFNNLLKDYPGNPLVLVSHGEIKIGEEEFDEAESLFIKALEISPENKRAIRNLEEIKLARKNLPIRDIYIKNSVKTSSKRVLQKVESYKGESFNFSTKSDIGKEISKISSIGGVTIKGIESDAAGVDLELTIAEDNTRVLAVLAGGPVSLDRDKNPQPGIMGAFLYMDNNLFGSGIKLQYITAGVYNKLTLNKPGLINDGIVDLKFSGESMLYPGEVAYVENGEIGETLHKKTFHNLEVGLGRELPIGVSAFANYKIFWDLHEKSKDYIAPTNSYGHEVRGDFALNMAGTAMSGLQTLDGFNLSFTPKIIYKDDYKDWGDSDDLFTHDNNPSWQFTTKASYFKNIGERHNIATDISWFASINPYQSNRFLLGPAGNPMEPTGISGYLPGEFIVDNALLGNLKYTFILKPDRVNIFAKYDLLFDIDKENFYNGASLGVNSKLPWDIELMGEVGVGFDADRDDMPGIHLGLTVMKMYLI